MFSQETCCRELEENKEHMGAGWRCEQGGIRDPSLNKAHLIPTEKAKRREKAGAVGICLGN